MVDACHRFCCVMNVCACYTSTQIGLQCMDCTQREDVQSKSPESSEVEEPTGLQVLSYFTSPLALNVTRSGLASWCGTESIIRDDQKGCCQVKGRLWWRQAMLRNAGRILRTIEQVQLFN